MLTLFMTKDTSSHLATSHLGKLVQLRISPPAISRIVKEVRKTTRSFFSSLSSLAINLYSQIIKDYQRKKANHEYYLPQSTTGKLISEQRTEVIYPKTYLTNCNLYGQNQLMHFVRQPCFPRRSGDLELYKHSYNLHRFAHHAQNSSYIHICKIQYKIK